MTPGNKIGKQFTSDYPPNRGKTPGAKNRSTIVKKVFEMQGILPQAMFEKLKEIFPEITQQMTFEEIATIAQVAKAVEGDTAAYKATMDSRYGAPMQEIEHGGGVNITATLNVLQGPPLHNSEKEITD